MIKINSKKILVDFLKKVHMTGDQKINDCVWNFKPEGLVIEAVSIAKQSKIVGILKRSIFAQYEEIGVVGIDKFETTIKVIEKFTNGMTFAVNGNLATIKDEKKKVDIELVNPDFVDKIPEQEKKFEYKETFNIAAAKLNEIIEDISLNKDAKMIIMTKENHVVFTNTGKFKFEHKIPSETKTEQKSDFGDAFISCVANLDGSIEVSMGTDYPCRIKETTEHSVIEIVVAPIVEEKE